jgi:signal transduction histidine kinase
MTEKLNLRFEERLAERTRIAQELHDTLLQGFLSASMQLHVAAEQLPANSPVRSSLDRVLALMHQVNQEGRNTLRGLRSETVDSTTLEQDLSRVPHDLAPALASSANHPAFRVIVQGQPRALHPVIRDEVRRIGREAILNALLHAKATAVEVELEYTRGHLHLLIRDDGIGIAPEILQSGREGHWGIIGMRERAGRIGANLKLFSRAGAGTEVELEVPGNIAYQNPSNGLRYRLTRLFPKRRRRVSS